MDFLILGICYLCQAQHSREVTFFFFSPEFKTEHVSSKQPPSFVRNVTADSFPDAEESAEPFL